LRRYCPYIKYGGGAPDCTQRGGGRARPAPRPAALLCSHRQRPAAPAPALHSTERGPRRSLRAAGPPPARPPKGRALAFHRHAKHIFCIIWGSAKALAPKDRPLRGTKYEFCAEVRQDEHSRPFGGRAGGFASPLVQGAAFPTPRPALQITGLLKLAAWERRSGRHAGPRCARRGVRPVVGCSLAALLLWSYLARPHKPPTARRLGKAAAASQKGSRSAGVALHGSPVGRSPASAALCSYGSGPGNAPPRRRSGSKPAPRSAIGRGKVDI